ncbi:MAG: hypothetical protein KGL39_27675 [Patescibacteria group bacterium]|nr:hypothetical protein [Patescibacteria group bacterium]
MIRRLARLALKYLLAPEIAVAVSLSPDIAHDIVKQQAGPLTARDAANAAAAAADIGLLRARANGCPWDERVGEEAAWNGRLDVLKWARANGCSFADGPYGICYTAWKSIQQEVLRWLKTNGCTCGGKFHF